MRMCNQGTRCTGCHRFRALVTSYMAPCVVLLCSNGTACVMMVHRVSHRAGAKLRIRQCSRRTDAMDAGELRASVAPARLPCRFSFVAPQAAAGSAACVHCSQAYSSDRCRPDLNPPACAPCVPRCLPTRWRQRTKETSSFPRIGDGTWGYCRHNQRLSGTVMIGRSLVLLPRAQAVKVIARDLVVLERIPSRPCLSRFPASHAGRCKGHSVFRIYPRMESSFFGTLMIWQT